jgi:hypothetical protein
VCYDGGCAARERKSLISKQKSTAIGRNCRRNKHRLDFPPVEARLFRLNIRKVGDTPTQAEFQLFGK